MKNYEITGYVQIPTTVTVQADTPEDALEIGRDLIKDGFGILGISRARYQSDNYYLATEDGEPVGRYNDGELILEGQV